MQNSRIKFFTMLLTCVCLFSIPSSSSAQMGDGQYIVQPYLTKVSYTGSSVSIPLYFMIQNFSNTPILLQNINLEWEVHNQKTGSLVKKGTISLVNGTNSGFAGYKQWPHSQSISPITDPVTPPVSVTVTPGKYFFSVSLKLNSTGAYIHASNMVFIVNSL